MKKNLFPVILFFLVLCLGLSSFASTDHIEKVQDQSVPKSAKDQLDLGVEYYEGDGINKNYSEALRLFKLAAKQGESQAQANLGTMYYNGIGTPQNYKEAFKWYKVAAEKNNSTAQGMLGLMYGKGLSVPQDLVLAYFWANIAASSNDEEQNIVLRDNLLKKMSPPQIEQAQEMARNWHPQKN